MSVRTIMGSRIRQVKAQPDSNPHSFKDLEKRFSLGCYNDHVGLTHGEASVGRAGTTTLFDGRSFSPDMGAIWLRRGRGIVERVPRSTHLVNPVDIR
jgi:hypothetical protein